jgi:ABC-type histidine transport system ATPase subunit
MAMLRVSQIEIYYWNVQALRGISLEVKEGRIVTLIGAWRREINTPKKYPRDCEGQFR